MNFLYPNILWCLFALAIPIIIHLFNFRRHKVVYFSNTATLKTIELENAKTKKLKYFIVMVVRILFITCLVFAFAYPYNRDQQLRVGDTDNLMAIYIDNSKSMQSQSSEISLIEDARASARKIVSNISPSQRFVLLTNSRQPDNEYPMNQDEMLMRIDAMQTDASPMSFNVLYENLQMIMRRDGFKTASLFVFSDFQNNMMNTDGIIADSTIQIVAMPLSSDYQQNIYVDTVWLTSPILQIGLANEVNARIVNESAKEVHGLPVYLEIDGSSMAFTTVDIPANGKSDIAMQFVLNGGGEHAATVFINDYPITFDDKYNFMLNVRPVIKIVELSTNTDVSPTVALFSNDSIFEYHVVDPRRIDLQYLADCQMIIVDDEADINETMHEAIIDFAKDGGSVVLLPSKEVSDDTLSISTIASSHEFFSDIFINIPDNADLPKVYKYAEINKRRFHNTLTLISLQNNTSFFTLSKVGGGNVFGFASQFGKDWTNFADNALFVPIMYKIAMLGGRMNRLAYTIGQNKEIMMSDLTVFAEGDMRIRDAQGNFEMIPMVEMRNNRAIIRFYDELPGAGFYAAVNGNEVLETTAWNDNRNESEMVFATHDEINKVLKDKGLDVVAVMNADDIHSGDMMKMLVHRSTIWRTFVIMALISLLIEILVLRFWK